MKTNEFHKKHNKIIWTLLIQFIAFVLLYLVLVFLFFYDPFAKTPNTAIIPEPYKNPQYCDENIGCGLYGVGGGVFCGNMYYVNQLGLEKAITPGCICNTTKNRCI